MTHLAAGNEDDSRDETENGLVSVVVLNWNSGALGRAATASALAQTWRAVEVVVVDNASSDDSLTQILGDDPDVVVVQNDENLGFARGMNRGIEAAKGEFVLPLNCDAELEPTYIERLLTALHEFPDAAAAGGRVTSSRVDESGPLAITATMRTKNLPIDKPRAADKLNGACPLFRRAAIDHVIGIFGGPYDGSYDMYGEDIDLALSLKALGWTYRYEPTARASHLRSYGSAPRIADRRGRFRVSTLANRHRNIIRHAPSPWILRSLVALGQDLGFIGWRLVAGDVQAPADVARAWRRVAANFRNDRSKRASLKNARVG